MRDYYIAVDENGQPYIKHGFLDRVKGSKYYQKIKTAYGTRYFYDPEEWKAYVEGRGNKPTSLVGKAKDKLGFDERERYNRATDRASNSNFLNRGRLEREAAEARDAYGRTALGRAENARNSVSNAYNSARTGISNARESIENFGRQAREDIENSPGAKAVRGVRSAVNTAADKLGFDERQRYKDNPNDETREEYENTALGKAEKTFGQIKDKATRMREEFQKRNNAQYSDYNENDPDFNDENYTEDRRVGQTDFFMFKGNNGRPVIVEEDMKWTLPKDIDPNSPEIRAALEKAYDLPGETWEEWAKNVSSILDEAIKVARNK